MNHDIIDWKYEWDLISLLWVYVLLALLSAANVSVANLRSLFVLSLSLCREYVSSKTINKVIQVHDRIFCCMAGSLADAQAVTKAAKFHLSFHRCHTHEYTGTFYTTMHTKKAFFILKYCCINPTLNHFLPNSQTGFYFYTTSVQGKS